MKNSKIIIASVVILRILPKDFFDYTTRFFAFSQNDFIGSGYFNFFILNFEFTNGAK